MEQLKCVFVRLAQAEDVSAIVSISRKYAGRVALDFPQIRAYLDAPDTVFLVADEVVVLGFIIGRVGKKNEDGAGEVVSFGFEPYYTGEHMTGALFASLEQEFCRRGVHQVLLSSTLFHRDPQLPEWLGYRAVPCRDHGLKRRPQLSLMTKQLEEK
jgi:N-acetylglutamate synthase-like GNAT family acetyltransferase